MFWEETIIWGIFRFVSFRVKIKIIGGNKSCLFLKRLECCFLLELCLLSVQATENTEIKSCDNTVYVIIDRSLLTFFVKESNTYMLEGFFFYKLYGRVILSVELDKDYLPVWA